MFEFYFSWTDLNSYYTNTPGYLEENMLQSVIYCRMTDCSDSRWSILRADKDSWQVPSEMGGTCFMQLGLHGH